MATASSLKEYLKKYESNDAVKEKKKKKKKQKKTELTGVLVVDEDPVWQKPVILEEEKDDSADEEKPQVDEDIEVKRMKRLEQLKSVRPYGVISEDGSGWVSVADTPQKLNLDDHYADISPPRKHRLRNDTPSPEPTWKSSTEANDLSPPRQRRHYHTPSPEHETKPLDSSPPRKRAHNDAPSSERKSQRLKLDGTVSDLSPARRRSHDLDPDLSPPRRVPSGSANQSFSRSSPREDLSPPRNRRGNIPRSPVEDLSPPRKSKRDAVASPKSDLSPPRNRRGNIPRSPVEDLSPPRKSRRDTMASPKLDLSPPRKSRNVLSPPKKTMKDSTSLTDRPKTGLVTGKDVKEEVLKTKNEAFLRFKAKDPSITGRGAEPVYRDKITGERLSKDQVLKLQKKEEKPKEIKLEWGKGLAQKREAEARMQELELEKEKPFARTRDDPDLDRIMKDRLRWGDPMAHLVKRKQPDVILRDIGDDEKMKASGFIVPQEVPNHSWIKRRLDPAPNRYGIKPGRHWDGVDRSTGFEKAMFKRTNEKQATEREAYLWSVADM